MKPEVSTRRNTWHRRHAVQLAAQLPPRLADAKAVLAECDVLLSEFIHRPARAAGQSRGAAVSRRRARSTVRPSVLPR